MKIAIMVTAKKKQQSGMSLVELMVAMVIGLFLTAGVFTMFSMSSSNVTTTSQFNQLQENGRIALAIMERDLSQLGFFGDLTGTDFVVGVNTEIAAAITKDCVGSGLNNKTLPSNVTSHFRRLWGYENAGEAGDGETAVALTCLPSDVADKTDVIQIKRLIGPSIAKDKTTDNRIYVVTNSSEAIFFDAGAAPSIINGRYWEYQQHVYYIEDAKIPVLRRRTLTSEGMLDVNDDALVEGIENFRVLYGFDADGDNTPDSYIPAKDVSTQNWDNESFQRLVALKLFILVRSIQEDRSYINETEYQFGDKKLKPSNDHYRRKVMSTTIVLENPVLIRS